MSVRRRELWWGEVRCWKRLRIAEDGGERGVLQTFQGVGQASGIVIPLSPNNLCRVVGRTFFDPHPTRPDTEGFRATISEMRRALEVRSHVARTLMVADPDVLGTVASVAGMALTLGAAAPFAAGDRVLVRRSGTLTYTFGVVNSVTGGGLDTINLAGVSHLVAIGDTVRLVTRAWGGMVYEAMARQNGMISRPDFFAEEAGYPFVGTGLPAYERVSVNLDA